MIFPITTTFLEYSSKRERKILGLLRQHKVSFLKMVHVSSSEGKMFDFSASPIAFLSQSSGAAGFLLWSQEEVPGSSPWERSRGTQVGEPESALEFSVWVFSS